MDKETYRQRRTDRQGATLDIKINQCTYPPAASMATEYGTVQSKRSVGSFDP